MHKVTETHVMGDKPAPWMTSDVPNHWKVTLHYRGRQMSTDFWTGSRAGEPDAKSVTDCLISDTYLGQGSFEDFCDDLGLDQDSRKAYSMWQACQKQGERVRRFLGADFDDVAMWAQS